MDKPLLVDAKVDMGTEVATLVAVPSSRLGSRGPEISSNLSAKVAVSGRFESKPAADALPPVDLPVRLSGRACAPGF